MACPTQNVHHIHHHRPDHHIRARATPTHPTNPQADRPTVLTTLVDTVAADITVDITTRAQSSLWDPLATRTTDTDPHAPTAALLMEDAELSLNAKLQALLALFSRGYSLAFLRAAS